MPPGAALSTPCPIGAFGGFPSQMTCSAVLCSERRTTHIAGSCPTAERRWSSVSLSPTAVANDLEPQDRGSRLTASRRSRKRSRLEGITSLDHRGHDDGGPSRTGAALFVWLGSARAAHGAHRDRRLPGALADRIRRDRDAASGGVRAAGARHPSYRLDVRAGPGGQGRDRPADHRRGARSGRYDRSGRDRRGLCGAAKTR